MIDCHYDGLIGLNSSGIRPPLKKIKRIGNVYSQSLKFSLL